MITLALSQLLYFIYLQTPFTHGEDGIQGIPQGHMFGFLDLSQADRALLRHAGRIPRWASC